MLARIRAHTQNTRLVCQARSALDAFGHAVLAVDPDERIIWLTPLARQWLDTYFPAHPKSILPPQVSSWLQRAVRARSASEEAAALVIARGTRRLIFALGEADEAVQWSVVLREEADDALVRALMAKHRLTQREAEVLHWVSEGKSNREIGDILGTSPRTVNKHLEHVLAKLGVETRTAAAALAMSSRPTGAA